jgi:hypothetical protein
MAVEAGLDAYLEEIRAEVCRRCAGRPVGDPGGTPCGAELPLGQLVEAIEVVEAVRQALLVGGTALAKDGGQAGPGCVPSRAGYCPCPLAGVAALAFEVAEDLDRERRRLERLLNVWDDG